MRTHPLWVALVLLGAVGFAGAVVGQIVLVLNSADPSDPIRWAILAPGIVGASMASLGLGTIGVWCVVDNRYAKV